MKKPTVQYIHLDYEAFKNVERQCKEFRETTHTTTPGAFYHKSLRLVVNEDFIIEFHAPLVRGDDTVSPTTKE